MGASLPSQFGTDTRLDGVSDPPFTIHQSNHVVLAGHLGERVDGAVELLL
jgi:hypothetical protein